MRRIPSERRARFERRPADDQERRPRAEPDFRLSPARRLHRRGSAHQRRCCWSRRFSSPSRRPTPRNSPPMNAASTPFDDARMKFDVRFYLVSLLFIIFDLEVAFLFPWAWPFTTSGALGFWSMMVFLGVLTDRLRLRMEEGSAGMGLSAVRSSRPRPRGARRSRDRQAGRRERSVFRDDQRRTRRQGLSGHHHRRPDPMGAHRLADVDDVRPRLLRGRDDAAFDAALRRRALRLRAARVARASPT